jgi:putative ABC transport system permease protein
MLSDLLLDAMRNIRGHWLRVLLTGSGIVWGIALFVALAAAGAATREHYREKMEAIGRKVIYAFPGSIPEQGGGSRTPRRVELDRDDPPRLPESPLIERAAPELWLGARVLKGGGHIKVVWTYGVGAETGRIRNFQIERGRFISPADEASRRRVLVIGAKVEQRLFGRRSALGRSVRLEGQPFRIIGVSVPKGQQMVNMGPNDDEQVLLPASTARTLFTGSDRIATVLYEPRTRPEGRASTDRVRAILSRHHHFQPRDEEALSFFNIADAMRVTEGIGFALQLFLGACGLLTLLAGGIGVMNIMLVAVAERTRELGLRKALGATNRDLVLQLLGETVLITLVAGVTGVGLGAGIIAIMRALRNSADRIQFLMPEIRFSADLALLSFAVLVGVGIAAGIAPALRAARLDPAVALRNE